LAATRA